jgi:putative component of membrane protein insertase Oxa1/YidC/SpoIIIJ protein YidD
VLLASLQTAAAERVTLGAIGFYRAHGSAAMRRLGGECRFEPSCSHYAELAIRKYGLTRGLLKAGVRVARCNPLTSRRGEIDYP